MMKNRRSRLAIRVLGICAALCCTSLAVGCGQWGEVEPTSEVTGLSTETIPPHTPTSAPTASPTAIPTSTSTPTPASTPTRKPAREPVELPLPLYFLADHNVWLLEDGEMAASRITSPDQVVSCFDVRSDDGLLAYGTSGGEVYLMMPHRQPDLLHDLSSEAAYPTTVSSVAWSPDGTRLAYTAAYTSSHARWEAGYPSYPSGLWLFDIEDGAFSWLLSNHHFGSAEDNAVLLSFRDPLWSPDGEALLLIGQYWESRGALLLDTIAPDSLVELGHEDITGASWSNDGRSLLLIGPAHSDYNNVFHVDRASLESELLVHGGAERLHFFQAEEMASGIVFLGQHEHLSTSLYLGNWSGEGFEYTGVGPERLCGPGGSSGDHVAWDSSGQWGVVVCTTFRKPELDEVYITTLDGEIKHITPYLSCLEDFSHLQAQWGETR